MLTRDQIKDCNDLPRKEVKVPEWGGSIYVRTLTCSEADSWELSKSKVNPRARLAVMAVCDDEGNALFDESDIEWLSKKSTKAMNRVVKAAMTINMITDEDIEELLGNS